MDDDVDDILEAVRRRAVALVAADAEALRSLMHPDVRWTTATGAVLTRDAYINGNTNGSLVWRAQRFEDTQVVVVGDTAVVTAVVEDEVTRDGQDLSFRVPLTMTWVRAAAGWQCLSGHAGPRL